MDTQTISKRIFELKSCWDIIEHFNTYERIKIGSSHGMTIDYDKGECYGLSEDDYYSNTNYIIKRAVEAGKYLNSLSSKDLLAFAKRLPVPDWTLGYFSPQDLITSFMSTTLEELEQLAAMEEREELAKAAPQPSQEAPTTAKQANRL